MAALMHESLLPWHAALWSNLHRAAGNGAGILLAGPTGHGKHFLARRFAQSLLCEAPLPQRHPCGACAGCLLFKANQHPDYAEVVSEQHHDDFIRLRTEDTDGAEDKDKKISREIRIKDVRLLQRLATLSAHRGGQRVILIWPADEMNTAAANAILKMLEEPGQGLQFLLVASHPSKLLPTVRSRIKVVQCPSGPPDLAAQWLQGQGMDSAGVALGLSVGAPLRALQFLQDKAGMDSLDLRQAFLQWLVASAKAQGQGPDRPAAFDKMDLAALLQTLLLTASELVRIDQGGQVAHLGFLTADLSAITVHQPRRLHELIRYALDLMPQAEHPLNVRMQLDVLTQRWQACFMRSAAA